MSCVEAHHRLDQMALVVHGPPRQRMPPAEAPFAQEEDRPDRDLVPLEELLEDLVDAPGRARDVEHRVALGAPRPGVQRPVEDARHRERRCGSRRPRTKSRQSIAALLATPVCITVSSMSDTTTTRAAGGRDVDLGEGRRRARARPWRAPGGARRRSAAPPRPEPSRRGNSRRASVATSMLGAVEARDDARDRAPAAGGSGAGCRGARSSPAGSSVRCQKARPMTKIRAGEP